MKGKFTMDRSFNGKLSMVNTREQSTLIVSRLDSERTSIPLPDSHKLGLGKVNMQTVEDLLPQNTITTLYSFEFVPDSVTHICGSCHERKRHTHPRINATIMCKGLI